MIEEKYGIGGKLTQVRNGHRTTAKKKVNTARELMQNYDPANVELYGKLKAICITLKEITEIVKEIDSQILDKTEENSAINKEIEETTDFKEYIQECMVMIDLTTKKGEVEEPDAATGNQNTSPPAMASALFTSEKGTPYCVYCTQQHRSTKCTVVTNIDARKAILRKKAKCFSCVRSGHLPKTVHQKSNVIVALKAPS